MAPRPTKANLPSGPAPPHVTRSSGKVAATDNTKTPAKAAAKSKSKSSLPTHYGKLPDLPLARGFQEKNVRCPCGTGEQTCEQERTGDEPSNESW